MKSFMVRATLGALLFSGAARFGLPLLESGGRTPASVEERYELTVQSLSLDAVSRFASLDNIFLRATFGQDRVMEFGRADNWKLTRGQSLPINIKIDIDRGWIVNDALEFRLELVQTNLIDVVLVRCAQVSREVSDYNRSYMCSIPGESGPLLTYRLARKGAPNVRVAGNP